MVAQHLKGNISDLKPITILKDNLTSCRLAVYEGSAIRPQIQNSHRPLILQQHTVMPPDALTVQLQVAIRRGPDNGSPIGYRNLSPGKGLFKIA